MGILLLLASTVIIAAAGFFVFGFLRSVKKKAQPEQNQDKDKYFAGYGSEEPAPDTEQNQPEEELPELINLVDYYADYNEENRETAPEPSKKPEPQEAMYDKLCNLKVGRGYLIDCHSLLLAMEKNREPYALAYFDFDRFRFVNTLKGYAIGDYALTRIAHEAQNIFPATSLFTRISADHFAVLFPFVDEDALQDIFNQLRRAAERIRADVGAKNGMQICMGVDVAKSSGGYDIFKMLRRANIARHCNKAAKGESYAFFNENMITSYLFGESAVENYKEYQYSDDISVYLCPQMLTKKKRITSCIAQARWPYEDISDNHLSLESGGVLSTNNFRVIYQACKAMSRWRKQDGISLSTMVAINEIDFFRQDVDGFFARCLEEFQLGAEILTVVISQHIIRLNKQVALGQLEKFKSIGLNIAISDFDRSLLHPDVVDFFDEFKPDFLKLNKSFAHEAEKRPERQEEIQKVMALASEIGAGVIFEGVDSAGTMAYISSTGATFIQGRYVGAPLIVDEFSKEMKDLLKTAYDPNITVVLDDTALSKGNFNVF